jgi:hypothetical protein
MVQVPELLPLLEKARELQTSKDAADVLAFISEGVENAATPAMAVSLCRSVKTMTHVKAWGDLNVQDFGQTWLDWLNFLGELGQVAEECALQIARRGG